jgi:WD40 repeat protein
LRGQTHGITGLAWGPDGRRVASVSGGERQGGTVKVWDEVGREVLTIPPVAGRRLDGVAFSPDGAMLAVGAFQGPQGLITLYEADSGRVLAELTGHTARLTRVTFHPGGKRLASASEDGSTRIWDVAERREVVTLRAEGGFGGVAWSPDGRTIATAGFDKSPRIWDAETGRPLRALEGHDGPIVDIAYRRDGRQLATASYDNTVRLWDAVTGARLFTLPGPGRITTRIAYSPDGRRLASAHEAGVRVWDPETGREVLSLSTAAKTIMAIAFSSDGSRLAIGCADGTVRLWESE